MSTRQKFPKNSVCAIAASAALTLALAPAAATDYDWTGEGGNDIWNDGDNWDPTGAPGIGDNAFILGEGSTPVISSAPPGGGVDNIESAGGASVRQLANMAIVHDLALASGTYAMDAPQLTIHGDLWMNDRNPLVDPDPLFSVWGEVWIEGAEGTGMGEVIHPRLAFTSPGAALHIDSDFSWYDGEISAVSGLPLIHLRGGSSAFEVSGDPADLSGLQEITVRFDGVDPPGETKNFYADGPPATGPWYSAQENFQIQALQVGAPGTPSGPITAAIWRNDLYVRELKVRGNGALDLNAHRVVVEYQFLLSSGCRFQTNGVWDYFHLRGEGARTDIRTPTSSDVSNLSQSQLIYDHEDGGTSEDPVYSAIEAPGQDMGAVQAGFSTANFMLGSLVVGRNGDAQWPRASGPITLGLINDYNNSPGTIEALYVKHLFIEAGGTFDLTDPETGDELPLYYQLAQGEPVGQEDARRLYMGDANLDGCVNIDDASILIENWLQEGPWDFADFNGDYFIDLDDQIILNANWGSGCSEARSLARVAPEPASVTVLLLGFAVFLRRRKA